tara:strand:- start:634 stop:1590 length:957 start_codon:yes stop_codon:yes gene_type:complete
MKDFYASGLEANQVVTTTFLVKVKEVRSKKSGEPYLSLILGDKSGNLDAKMWENVENVESTFSKDDFVKIKGLVQVYRNKKQLTIHRLRRCQETEIEFGDYFPKTSKNIDAMFSELYSLAKSVENSYLNQLLVNLLNDSEFAVRFKEAPAAKSLHHAWLGGLLEHTLSLCKLCKLMAQHYPEVDLDLLMTGAIIHDIGKIEELEYNRNFNYSTKGQLLGHMIIELDLVNQKISEIQEFPLQLKTLVQHLIVSHHGEYEFGSPKLPMFPEALLLHCLDNLDSKLASMLSLIGNDEGIDENWTPYNSMFGRPLFKSSQLK